MTTKVKKKNTLTINPVKVDKMLKLDPGPKIWPEEIL